MAYSGKIHIVYDGMWGSCGKGKFCGTFARNPKMNIKICVNNNTPNAGHTFVFDDGRKVVTRHLPIGVVNPDIPYLVIGESAGIDVDVLTEELDKYQDLINGRKIYICDKAAVVLPEDKEIEKQTLRTGSTFKGSGAALVGKIMRDEKHIAGNDKRLKKLARQGRIKLVDSKKFFPCVYSGLAGFKGNENILVECSQGDALSLNGSSFPHTTSRDCGPSQAIKDIHATDYSKNIRKYCVFRPYPIRINNMTEVGFVYNGDFDGAKEIDWKTVAERSGMPEELLKQIEKTTVTQRLRRVSEFSVKQFEEMLLDTKPDMLILNFAEHINFGISGMWQGDVKVIQRAFENPNIDWTNERYEAVCNKNFALEHVKDYVGDMEELFTQLLQGKVPVKIGLIGTGAKESEMIKADSIRSNSLGRYPERTANPLDYADKDNCINFDNNEMF